jgi:hypothetical protein
VLRTLHEVCEVICVLYENVDLLLVNRKKIFVKSPARSKAPDTITPSLVITWWGTWFMPLCIMQKNCHIFCYVGNEFDRVDASCVTILQEMCND